MHRCPDYINHPIKWGQSHLPLQSHWFSSIDVSIFASSITSSVVSINQLHQSQHQLHAFLLWCINHCTKQGQLHLPSHLRWLHQSMYLSSILVASSVASSWRSSRSAKSHKNYSITITVQILFLYQVYSFPARDHLKVGSAVLYRYCTMFSAAGVGLD